MIGNQRLEHTGEPRGKSFGSDTLGGRGRHTDGHEEILLAHSWPLGQNALLNFITGYYRRLWLEQRVFLFINIFRVETKILRAGNFISKSNYEI
jgi:hypothetical protein